MVAESVRVELVICPGCGGVWLDANRCRQLVEGLLGEVEQTLARRAAAESAGPKGGYRVASRPADEARRCPGCQAPMHQTVVQGLTVDACVAHGTWFDAGELPALAQWFSIRASEADLAAQQLVEQVREARARDQLRALGTGFRGFGR